MITQNLMLNDVNDIYICPFVCVKDKVSLVQLATISDESINSSVTLKAAQYIYHTSSVYTIYAS